MNRYLILFSFLLLPACYLFAQEMAPPPEPPQMNREARKQLEQIKIWQMTQEMDLPTDKAEKFFPLYNAYNSQLRDINVERRQAVRALDSLLRKNPEETGLKKRIQETLNLDAQLADEHQNFIRSLEGILSPIQVARYIVFEQKFDREIRERIRVITQQRMRESGY